MVTAMQTFLPDESFTVSAQSLDLSRLGKQIMEAGQIMRALCDPSYGWQNHPATKMWISYETALFDYMREMTQEWTVRRNKVHGAWHNIQTWLLERDIWDDIVYADLDLPYWLGDADFHRSHQSNLIRKKPEHYAPLWPEVPDDLDYIWPKPKITLDT